VVVLNLLREDEVVADWTFGESLDHLHPLGVVGSAALEGQGGENADGLWRRELADEFDLSKFLMPSLFHNQS
jgi:hypothetical protein